MENGCGLSVVIPYYKGKEFIECTIKSLITSLKQSKINYEIIVVNDSPNENINDLINYDPNIRVINNTNNKGIAYSRNVGKQASNYEYILFIDQDDWVGEDFFKEAYIYINKGYDMILFNYNIVKEKKIKRNYNLLFKYYFNFITAKSLIKYGNLFRTTGQVVLRKNIVGNFINTSIMGSDDAYLYIDLFSNKDQLRLKYVTKPLFYYRLHSDNYTKKTNFHASSLECFDEYQKQNKEVSKYRKYLVKRYSGDIYLNLMSKFIRKLITIF